jgi:membrane protein DedA with SNARE-associated domain
VPVLLAAGALVGMGELNPAVVAALTSSAALAADLMWYELGRHNGIWVLQLLCKISLEPDSCVRRTEDVFARHGARSLLVAKFLPGLSTAAAPLAGIFRMRRSRFLLLDAAGTAIWVGAFVGLGYAFSDQLELVAARALSLGSGLVVILSAALAGWITFRYVHRQRFLRQLRIDRITPEELKQKLDAGEEVVVVDLRGSLDFEAEPETIPGALRLDPAALEKVSEELARASEVVLYCT